MLSLKARISVRAFFLLVVFSMVIAPNSYGC